MIDRRTMIKAGLAGAFSITIGGRAARADDSIPITGIDNPAMASFDKTMIAFMSKRGIPGGALAVTRLGKLAYARGFGYADREAKQPVQPDSLFRIASLSKQFTATAILTLWQNSRYGLVLDRPAFQYLKDEPYLSPGFSVDPRLRQITVRHLLHHTGGWDRDVSGDPMFMPIRIARTVGTPAPADQHAIIRYMMGRPLDFDPGTRYAYSNFGYCVLGRIIETVSGMPYEEYVQKHVLHPLGINRMRLGRTRLPDRAPGEVRYYQPNLRSVRSIFPQDNGAQVDECYGGFNIEAMDSHGGWIASAVSLVRSASQLDYPAGAPLLLPDALALAREQPAPPVPITGGAWYGMGWSVRPVGSAGKANMWHTGSLPGTFTLLVRRHDGLAWAVVFNQREIDSKLPDGEIDSMMHPAADAVQEWPNRDLFGSR